MDPFNQMGRPILMDARAEGYEHCKAMGLTPARATECVNVVAEQLQRDKPYEAQAAGMKFLDLTGVYRLFAVMLTAAMKEAQGRRDGEHLFADCGGYPRCVTCGCDEDAAFVEGEECSYKSETEEGAE